MTYTPNILRQITNLPQLRASTATGCDIQEVTSQKRY